MMMISTFSLFLSQVLKAKLIKLRIDLSFSLQQYKHQKQYKMDIDDDTFRQQIMKHDEAKIWEKKLKMLKKGLLDERQYKEEIIKTLKLKQQRILGLQGEIEWKNRQNQTLQKEIKAIKDEILQQRNKKRKLRQQLMALDNANEKGSDQTRTADL